MRIGIALAWLLVAKIAAAAPPDRTAPPFRGAAGQAQVPAGDPDALFARARDTEDKLHDPARALELYDEILREAPDARVAIAARKRADALRELVGAHGEHAREAAGFAQLVADTDRLAPADVIARGDALAAATWPGAPEVALWLGEWLRRTGRYDEAQARFAAVIARWPGTDLAARATRGAAGCAIDAHDWARAEQLAAAVEDPDVRAALEHEAARGRARERWYLAAWLGLAAAFAALAVSLAEAALRGGTRRPPLRPPVEVLFLAPIAAVLVGVSFTAHRAIAPAVLRISLVGVALAWLSGTALDLVRARGRAVRARSLAHIAACIVGVVAIGYIAVVRDGLLDMLVETVQFGPGS